WIPDSVNTAPRYSPALVAFVPFSDNEIGWVPLGPGDPYVARYYDQNWQPHYVSRGDLAVSNLVNYAVPNAVTVVPVDYFNRPIDSRYVRHVNPASLAQVRPTLDPLLVTPLRNAVVHSAWGRGKIDLPPGIAKKLNETPVVLGTTPTAPPFRKDLDKSMRLERSSDKAKLQVRDDRGVGTAGVGTAKVEGWRKQQETPVAPAARENKDERQQVRQQEQQQRSISRQQQKFERRNTPAAQGAPVANPVKNREAPRPQIQRAPPVREAPRPQVQRAPPVREAPRPQVQRSQPAAAAPAKHQDKQPPGQSKAPGGGGGGGGKGHGKKP
ncbi:MAG TPA: hypothetical protein VN696_16655, partial [Pyrinomonadaceae bacterium]|nr:hypothetical protein [Pyrinomonadaceae bacterium]